MDQQKNSFYKYYLVTLFASVILSRIALGSIFFIIPILLFYSFLKNRDATLGLLGIDFVALVLFAVLDLKGQYNLSFFVVGLYFPLCLISGTALWILFDRKGLFPLWRFVFSTSSVLIISIVSYFILGTNTDSQVAIKEIFTSMFNFEQIGLDPDMMFEIMVDLIKKCFFAMSVFLLGFNIFAAQAISNKNNYEWSHNVGKFKIDNDLIFYFLGFWLVVVFGTFIDLPDWLDVTVWNAALAIGIIYGFQGFAVIASYFMKKDPYFPLGKLIWTLILFGVLPGLNFVIVFGLPVLGVLGTWIKFKRV